MLLNNVIKQIINMFVYRDLNFIVLKFKTGEQNFCDHLVLGGIFIIKRTPNIVVTSTS